MTRRRAARPPAPDPVRLEIFRNLFVSVCEEMGLAVMRTGCSPNIKERRDYSCAVFDAEGRTIAQGDHMPVHLGSMPASVSAALEAFRPGPGDVVLLNDPFRGGTHLPDLTVVAPLFARRGDRRALFFLADRAHHSDVGGMSPGSMPLATDIHQEGLVIPPVLVARAGRLERDILRLVLANCRTPEEREGDLRAQLAALATGERRMRELIGRYGPRETAAYGRHLQAYSRRLVEEALRRIPDGTYRFEDRLDDDGAGSGPIPLRVALTIRGPRAVVDLRDCADQVAGGVNAVASITASAVHYVFRCLLSSRGGSRRARSAGLAGEIPWNAGGIEPIRILLREGSVLAARPPAAVAGGNVETSQRVVDLLLGALAGALPGEIPAASQGTMNNIAFGGRDPATGAPFAYYETIAGGMGGRPAGPGLSGVHTHMTNSLNTPIEALETSFPLVVAGTRLRRGSGGAGRCAGGEGIVREIRFLAGCSVAVLSERRRYAPWGLAGGRPGAAGQNALVPAGGKRERPLAGKFNHRIAAGETLVIRTPGGGGLGRPRATRREPSGPKRRAGMRSRG